MAKIRSLENFHGTSLDEVHPGSPAVVLGFGIYFFARPSGEQAANHSPILPSGEQVKQILGEQEIQYTTYEIKKGDTLFNLSQRYGISWQTLAEINSLKEPYILRIGQKIKVPAK